MCCSSWGRKESDTTERLNRTETALLYSMREDFKSLSDIKLHVIAQVSGQKNLLRGLFLLPFNAVCSYLTCP